MAWLWNSWEEYVDSCHPVAIQRGRFNLAQHSTQLERTQHLLESVEQLSDAMHELNALGFNGRSFPSPKYERQKLHAIRDGMIHAVYAGEALLLYHRRLALDEASDGFLSQHDVLDHWERYAVGERVIYEIQHLVESLEDLLEGYRRVTREDEKFLLDGLDLPDELEADFRLARDLASVGFDGVSLFTAARGLEKVLRRIASDRKIQLEIGKKTVPASRADLHDLIEVMSRVHWKVRGTPLLSKEARTLLQFVRSVRNGAAHTGQNDLAKEDVRHTASVIAKMAHRLWGSTASTRARLTPTTVQKHWS